MASPVSFRPQIQYGPNDCMIAALSMLLGCDYLTVQKAATRVVPTHTTSGITCHGAVKIVRELGRKAKNSPLTTLPASSVSGVLAVSRGKRGPHHAVLLFEGIICDPADGTIWEAETWLEVNKYRPFRFLTV